MSRRGPSSAGWKRRRGPSGNPRWPRTFRPGLPLGGKRPKYALCSWRLPGGGKKGFADKWIAAAGVDRAVVDKILDNHMCCYSVKILE